MNGSAFRTAVADALRTIDLGDDTPQVLDVPVDAVEPPAYLLRWGPDPWLTVDTHCMFRAQLEVLCIAGRLTPEANYPILETIVDSAAAALDVARLRPYQVLSPAPLEVAQITYLAARMQIRRPITTGGN